MTAVFVGGSRGITRLPVEATRRIDNIVHRGLAVLVGDANGADRAVQKHLAEARYDKVTVFCSGGTSRNNVGQWPLRNVNARESERGYQFYAAKDREMALQADFGLMIWDGRSVGTALNILRLVRGSKKAVLIRVAEKSEVDFKCKADWDVFVSRCPLKLRQDMEKRATQDELFMLRPEQEELSFGESDAPSNDAFPECELKSGMDEALVVGDTRTFVELLGRMARQEGMSRVAQETGLAREALYRALSSKGNPEFATIVKVTSALGLQLYTKRTDDRSTGSD